MSYVFDRKVEAAKILKYLKSMETILRTNPNPEQKERVKKDMMRYWNRLREMLPDIDFSEQTPEKIASQLDPTLARQEYTSSIEREKKGILDHIPFQKISPNCNDSELNLLYSMLSIIEQEYWPAIYERYCKLDFSHGAARGRLKLKFESILRSMQVIAQIIEDQASGEQTDIYSQLSKTRNRHVRSLMIEVNTYMHELTSFLRSLLELSEQNRLALQNANDIIQFDKKFEQASMFEGVTVENALKQFLELGISVINHTKLPELKKNNNIF